VLSVNVDSNLPNFILAYIIITWPITVAARCKVWTIFPRSKTRVVCSNPSRGMNVFVRFFCVCVVCVYVAALRRADPPFKESYRLCIGVRNWRSGHGLGIDIHKLPWNDFVIEVFTLVIVQMVLCWVSARVSRNVLLPFSGSTVRM
jgi:hypothetical protein